MIDLLALLVGMIALHFFYDYQYKRRVEAEERRWGARRERY